MTWPAETPLTLPPAGTLLADAAPEQHASVEEDRKRWTQAHAWRREVLAGKATKADVWARIKDAPEAYREDMVRRLREIDTTGRTDIARRERGR